MPKGGNGGGGNSGGENVIRGNKWDNLLAGTGAADRIEGKGGNDTLEGLGGNDTLNGGEGDDLLIGGLGDDIYDGGLGVDVAVFSGNRADYTVTQIDAETVQVVGPDGADTVTAVEVFEFADITQSFAEVIIPFEPNVSASNVVLSSTAVIEGESIGGDWDVLSDGTADADASLTQLVVATAPDMTAEIATLGVQSTGALATGETGSFAGVIDTSGLAAGTYYVAAVADAGDVLAESDEADNVSTWVSFTVEAQVVDYWIYSVEIRGSSDFDLNADPDTGVAGGNLDLGVTIVSDSNVGATEFLIETWLSADGVLSADDIQISSPNDVVTLELFEAATIEMSYDIDEFFVPGDYHVITVLSPTTPDSGPYDDPSDNTFTYWQPVSLTGGWQIGTAGDDLFEGTGVQQSFDGLDGNDTLNGDFVPGYFDGGEGIDTLDFSSQSEGMYVLGNYPSGSAVDVRYDTDAVAQTVPADYVDDVLVAPDLRGTAVDVERVIGSEYADNFSFYGTKVTEVYSGGGDDAVIGSANDDIIDTGSGNDLVAGMEGDDILTSGAGSDAFFFFREAMSDGSSTGHGHDVITDFDPMFDMLDVWLELVGDDYDPFNNLSETADGTLLAIADDSSVMLMGVNISDLTAENLTTSTFAVVGY